MPSWDAASRLAWKQAQTDRKLAQAAYEALGGEDELAPWLPTVWEQFAALSGGGDPFPALPAEVTAAWEPDSLTVGSQTEWVDKVSGLVLTGPANDVVAGGAWSFVVDGDTTIQRYLDTANGEWTVAFDAVPSDGCGVVLVYSREPSQVGFAWRAIPSGGGDLIQLLAVTSGQFQLTRGATGNQPLAGGVQTISSPVVTNCRFTNGGMAVQAYRGGNPAFDVPPQLAFIATAAEYPAAGADFGVGDVEFRLSGVYAYQGDSAPVMQYILSRYF